MGGRGDAWEGGWRERTARCDAPRTNIGLIRTNAAHCNRPKPNAVRGALQWPKPNAVRGARRDRACGSTTLPLATHVGQSHAPSGTLGTGGLQHCWW